MSSRPRLVARGSPLPAEAAADAAADANAGDDQQHTETDMRSYEYMPSHVPSHHMHEENTGTCTARGSRGYDRENRGHARSTTSSRHALQAATSRSGMGMGSRSHHHHRRRQYGSYESHGHGAVTAHITIGGGPGGSGNNDSSSRSNNSSSVHHHDQSAPSSSSSLAAAAAAAAAGHRPPPLPAHPPANAMSSDRNRPPAAHTHTHTRARTRTQLHTHLVIGGSGGDSGGCREAAAAAGDAYYAYPPHRLVIGGYTGHVSAGMQTQTQTHMMNDNNNMASESMLAPEDYDYDLLGGKASLQQHGHSNNNACNRNGDDGGDSEVEEEEEEEEETAAAAAAERMEVEDIIPLPPLIVIDGANVAYAFGKARAKARAKAKASVGSSNNISAATAHGRGRSFQADARGILIACNYFLNAGCRVQVVLPSPWLQSKSQRRIDDDGSHHYDDQGDVGRPTPLEMTPQLEVLHGLREQGLLCAAPANDDDDSYAIMLARREDARAARRRGGGQAGTAADGSGSAFGDRSIVDQGGGFVLSNDQFRDAQSRDRLSSAPTALDEWLEGKKKSGGVGGGGTTRSLQDRANQNKVPGRISYSFGDVGSMDQYGDKVWDLLPNPRHPLVKQIEQSNRARDLSLA